jgi:hypothetical protein
VAPLYGVAPNTVTERAKVEYVKVEEKDCLQPIVHGKDAVLKDYTEAELRWVQAAYPGSRAPQVEAILVLPNGRASLHVSDTITVVTPTGESVRVCFDVNVTTWQFGGPEDDGEGEDEAEPGI